MIKKINKPLEIIYDENRIELPESLRQEIKIFWNKVLDKEQSLWDGEIICVQECIELEDKIILKSKATNYSHFLYDERIGIKDNRYGCFCLWGGILLKTTDNYFVLGEMEESTSIPLCLQISGGCSDKKDKIDGKINIENTIFRELKEEVNLDVNNRKQILNYELKYLEIPEGKRHVYGIIAVGNLNMTKQEIERYYNDYKQELESKNEEIEFKQLRFFNINNACKELENINNPKRGYILEIFKLEEKE